MINNLFEKAKSAIEDVSKNLQSPTMKRKSSFEYDESYFSVSLEGGPKHSERLVVHAKIKQGENAGENLPLSCKWFVSQIGDELVEIQDVTGTSYQPTIDDVGCRILVQATPLLDGTYIGMPIFKEVGPLKLDPELEQKAQAQLEKKECELKVKIESIYFDYDFMAVPLPCNGILTLSAEDGLSVSNLDAEGNSNLLSCCKYSDRYPNVAINKKSQTTFELHLDPIEVLKLSAPNHNERDLITIIIRMFNKLHGGGTQEDVHQPEGKNETAVETKETKTQALSFEETMKIDQLSKLLKETEKEKQYFKESFDIEKAKRQNLENELQVLKERVASLEKDNEAKTEQAQEYAKEKQALSAEKLFLLQESNLYKSQISELERVIQTHETNAAKMQEQRVPIIEEKKEDDKYEELIAELNKKMSNLQEENEQQQKEIKELKHMTETSQNEKETLESTIRSLQKKNQSLIQECEKLTSDKVSSPTSSSFWNFPGSPLSGKYKNEQGGNTPGRNIAISPLKIQPTNNEEITQLKEKITGYEEDLKHLREKNIQLNMTIETMKVAQDGGGQGVKRKLLSFVTGGAGAAKPGGQDDYLQKLVNTLTETIAEKDFVLENTKRVNKELGKRIQELEEKLNK